MFTFAIIYCGDAAIVQIYRNRKFAQEFETTRAQAVSAATELCALLESQFRK